MADLNVIFTNNALNKMKALFLTENTILDAFNKGETEKSSYGGWKAIKKYPGYEIGVFYNRKPTGEWVIISVWKRNRR
jgi:hypothetical protein